MRAANICNGWLASAFLSRITALATYHKQHTIFKAYLAHGNI